MIDMRLPVAVFTSMRISDRTLFRVSFVSAGFSQISHCLTCPLSFYTLLTLVIFCSHWIWFRSITEQEKTVWHLVSSIGFSQILSNIEHNKYSLDVMVCTILCTGRITIVCFSHFHNHIVITTFALQLNGIVVIRIKVLYSVFLFLLLWALEL
jgi:hypothetical protein